MIRKEFLQLRRDPALLRLVVLMPVIQLVVLSYALNNDLRNLRVGILDEDHTPLSRRIVDAFPHSETFTLGPAATSPADLQQLLRQGRCDLAIHLPPDFSRDVTRGQSPAVAIVVDGTNSSIAGRGAGYAEAVISREAAHELAATGKAATAPITGAVRFFYNPELESRLYMVPGIIVMLVTIISALLTGMAVVREKEIGTLEQVLVTPLSSWQYIAGKMLPYALLALVDLALATVFAMAWFHVPMTGSPWVLLLGVACYLLVTLGLGLLASSVSDTQQQAMFTVWFFLVFAILLSGFFFPVENMPAWARLVTWLNPMRFFMAIVRGVLLRGAGVADLARDLLVLVGMGTAAMVAAVLSFRRSGA